MNTVLQNIQQLKTTIPSDVTLIAVSKTKPNEAILEAYDSGQRVFGENKVQELVNKHEQLPKDVEWHLIGHLQTNKVKYIAPFVSLIHAVDSLKLLKEINKQAIKNNRSIDCLLQVKIAQEESKFGLSYDETKGLMGNEELQELSAINIVGLMGMATNTTNREQISKEFGELNTFFIALKEQYPSLKTLSMGMSSDYEVAIKEGANMIRVGSSIFGERNY